MDPALNTSAPTDSGPSGSAPTDSAPSGADPSGSSSRGSGSRTSAPNASAPTSSTATHTPTATSSTSSSAPAPAPTSPQNHVSGRIALLTTAFKNRFHPLSSASEPAVEPTYCVCNDISHGIMVACEAADCPHEWFHLACIGLDEIPARRQLWFCPGCRVRLRVNEDGSVAL